jgi:transcription initiation factor TFIIIB Brf1 subunit/transcription initiation factor TFIIB
MICKECDQESSRTDVCTNCGLVYEDRPIAYDLAPRPRNRDKNEYDPIPTQFTPLSPNIQFTNSNRKRYYKKDEDEYKYMLVYTDVKKFCDNLQLPKTIMNEALNIYKNVIKQDPNFLIRYSRDTSCFAFIKIACRIHDRYIYTNILLDMSINSKNVNKRFNSAMSDAYEILGIKIINKKYPSYIDYVCFTLNLDYKLAKTVHETYALTQKYFNSACRYEGYVLALYNLLSDPKITIATLSKTFKLATVTIGSRKKELMRIMNLSHRDIKNRTIWKGDYNTV